MNVILANGDFPVSDTLRTALQQASFLICCDGAANSCLAHGIEPHVIIGDVDSVSEAVRNRYAERIIRISEQETNDLTKAVKYALSLGYDNLLILGATGLREDHTLANISLLMDYAEEATVCMESDYGYFYPCHNVCDLTVERGTEVSIFNFGAIEFSSEGLLYPLYNFEKLWQGTLNVATTDRICITAKGCFLVYVSKETSKAQH